MRWRRGSPEAARDHTCGTGRGSFASAEKSSAGNGKLLKRAGCKYFIPRKNVMPISASRTSVGTSGSSNVSGCPTDGPPRRRAMASFVGSRTPRLTLQANEVVAPDNVTTACLDFQDHRLLPL